MSPLWLLTNFYFTQSQKEEEVLSKPSLILSCRDICEMCIFVPNWVMHPPIHELGKAQLYSQCVHEPPEVHQLLLLVYKQIQSLCQEEPYLHCWARSLVQLSVFLFKATIPWCCWFTSRTCSTSVCICHMPIIKIGRIKWLTVLMERKKAYP